MLKSEQKTLRLIREVACCRLLDFVGGPQTQAEWNEQLNRAASMGSLEGPLLDSFDDALHRDITEERATRRLGILHLSGGANEETHSDKPVSLRFLTDARRVARGEIGSHRFDHTVCGLQLMR